MGKSYKGRLSAFLKTHWFARKKSCFFPPSCAQQQKKLCVCSFSAPQPKRSLSRSFVPENHAVGNDVLRRFHALFAIKAAYFAKINLQCRLLSPHGTPPQRRARARSCTLEYLCRSYRPPWRHKGQAHGDSLFTRRTVKWASGPVDPVGRGR